MSTRYYAKYPQGRVVGILFAFQASSKFYDKTYESAILSLQTYNYGNSPSYW